MQDHELQVVFAPHCIPLAECPHSSDGSSAASAAGTDTVTLQHGRQRGFSG